MAYKDKLERNRKQLAYKKKWAKEHPEESREKARKKYWKNIEKSRLRLRKYYNKIKDIPEYIERRRRRSKKYWDKNKSRLIEKRKNDPILYEKYKIRKYANRKLRDILIEDRKCCELCGNKENLELHHKQYTKNREDIQLLCRNCHRNLHYNLKKA